FHTTLRKRARRLGFRAGRVALRARGPGEDVWIAQLIERLGRRSQLQPDHSRRAPGALMFSALERVVRQFPVAVSCGEAQFVSPQERHGSKGCPRIDRVPKRACFGASWPSSSPRQACYSQCPACDSSRWADHTSTLSAVSLSWPRARGSGQVGTTVPG